MTTKTMGKKEVVNIGKMTGEEQETLINKMTKKERESFAYKIRESLDDTDCELCKKYGPDRYDKIFYSFDEDDFEKPQKINSKEDLVNFLNS